MSRPLCATIAAIIVFLCNFLNYEAMDVSDDTQEFGHKEELVDWDTPIIIIQSRTPERLRKRMTKMVVNENYDQCKSSSKGLSVTQVVRKEELDQNMNCDKFFKRADNNMEEFTIVAEGGKRITASVKFKYFPLVRGDKLRLRCFGKVQNGQFKGSKVTKLQIYNAEQIDYDCSDGKSGLKKTQYIEHDITFETKNGKIECKGSYDMGYEKFTPGLLFHRVLSEMMGR